MNSRVLAKVCISALAVVLWSLIPAPTKAQRPEDSTTAQDQVTTPEVPINLVAISGGGTKNHVAKFTGTSTIGNSAIFETGGSVGIGTTNPARLLHIVTSGLNGPMRVESTVDTTNPVIELKDNSPGQALNGAINFINDTNGGFGQVNYNFGTNVMSFATNAVSGRMVIDSSGNVGVGTTTPSNILTVAQGGGNVLADGYSTYSTRRLKINIRPLDGALERVEQLQGVSYDRKDTGKHEIGLVAEEVAQVVPEVVSHNLNTNEVQGVDYSRLSALLIEAMKSQEVAIERLEADVEQLKSKSAAH